MTPTDSTAPILVDLIIQNVHIASFSTLIEDDYGTVSNGLLAIKGRTIIYAGSASQAPLFQATETVNGKGGWLTPGLVDCHTHLVYAGSRADEFEALRQGKTYKEIAEAGGGIKRTVAATRGASEADLIKDAQQRLNALMQEGVTTIEIKSGYGLDVDNELKMLQVIQQLGETNPVQVSSTCLAAHAVPLEFSGDANAYLDLVINEILPAVRAENLADSVDVFCENIAFTAEQTKQLYTAANALDFQIKGHVEQLSQQQGTDVVCEFDGLSADHVEFVSDKQAQRLAEKDVTAVILPGAFYYLGETQKPPVVSFRKHGVSMAVATDQNPGSSPLCSILTAANMACVLFGLTPAEAFRGMTEAGAKALGYGKHKGQLREGFDADVLLWHVDHPRQIIHELNRFKPSRIWWQGAEQFHD